MSVLRLRAPRAPALALARTVGLLGLGVFALHALVPFGGHGARLFFDHWLYNGLLLLAVSACALRALVVPRNRTAWIALTLGAAAWAAGDIYYAFELAGLDEPPFPSLADAGYLLWYPAAYFGLIRLFRSRASTLSRGVWLDGLTAALASAALGAAVVVGAVLETTEGSTSVVVTNLAYPIGDVLLLALVVGVFALTRWHPGRTWLVIGASLATSAVVDGIYLYQTATGTYVEGTIFDVLWPAALLLLAEAAWRQDREAPVEVEGRPLLLVPAAAAAAAIGVLVWDHFSRQNALALVLSVGTLLAVIARTGLSFRENAGILERSRREAVTDPVTGLGNRRRLVLDLERVLATATTDYPWLLIIFDLDGFKGYNDTFGHLSGDALLMRLGTKLADVVETPGAAYRLGGDEFCVLTPVEPARAGQLVDSTAIALTEEGEGFSVGSSFGAVFLPTEATAPSDALRLADQRLYAVKYRKQWRRDRPHEVLLQALFEREPDLHDHLQGVAELSLEVGRELGLANDDLEDLHRAAQLHDIGKIAVPDDVLHKPGALDADEWTFIRRHTLVGQRILGVSPALRRVGEIVRSTHERWDGTGYPDGLAGEEIPLPARIITACDAFDAMTSDRRYRPALDPGEAFAELRRCAGSQFDPAIVTTVCDALERLSARATSA